MKNFIKRYEFSLLIILFAILLAGAISTYELGGDVYQKASQTEVINSQTPTSSTTNQTSGWKTYTNTKYGFSFKYPTDDVVEMYGVGGYLASSTSDSYAVNVFKAPIETTNAISFIEFRGETDISSPLTINSIIKASSCGEVSYCDSIIQKEKSRYQQTEIAGVKGYKTTSIDGAITYYFIQKSSKDPIIEISVFNSFGNNILNTFVITP